MDKQNIQNYLNLIHELLHCPSGKEIEVLHSKSFLINKLLIQLMEEEADKISQEWKENTEWLKKIAMFLAEKQENLEQLNQQFEELYRCGRFDEAERLAEEASILAQQIFGYEHIDVAISLNNLATIYYYQGYYADAETLLKEVLKIRKKLLGEEHQSVANGLNNLAELYRYMGRYLEAEALLSECLSIKKNLLGNNHLDVAQSWNNLSALYYSQGRYSEANIKCQEALNIKKNLLGCDHIEIAISLNNLAEIYSIQGRYPEAEKEHLESLKIRRKILGDEHPDVAQSLENLAKARYHQGQYSEAEKGYLESLKIRRKTLGDEHPDVGQSLNNLGELHRIQGRYSEAQDLLLESLAIAKAFMGDEHIDVAKTQNNLAELYKCQGFYSEAEMLLLEALEKLKRLLGGYEHPDILSLMQNLAGLYLNQKRYSEAEDLYKKVLAINKKLFGKKHPDVAQTQGNLAELYKVQGFYSKAEKLCVDALKMRRHLLGNDHADLAVNLSSLVTILATTDRPDQALLCCLEAATIYDKIVRQIFAFSSEKDRLSYLQEIREDFDGFLSLVSNHLRESPQAVQAAFDLILKRKALTASALSAQNEALYSDHYPHLTEDFHKLRDLSEQIIHLTFSSPQTEDFSTYQQQLAQLQAEHNNLQKNLASQVPEIQLQEQLPSHSDVSSELPAGSILIEFVRFDVFNFKAIPAHSEAQWQPARYLAFILPAGEPESVEMIDIGEAEYIDNLIREFRELISGVSKNTESQLGMFSKRPPKLIFRKYHPQAGIKLRQAIFDKLRPYLQGDEHLIIAPDGELNLVPFQILPNDDTGEKMLMDEFTISYLTVGRDIMRQKIETKRPASLKALVFASPNFDLSTESVTPDEAPEQNTLTTNLRECIANKPLKPAVGTNILGERVAQRLKVAPYVENKAIESYFKPLQCPRILLIATHGVFLPNQPEDRSPTFPYQMENGLLQRDRFFGQVENPMLRSALALAGANTWAKGGKLSPEAGKGIIFAQDVAGLDLWANEITVLSACETAIGDVAIGEGVFGLRRAFAVAGTKTLIMSLWSVNGWTTTLLMERFFDNCKDGLGRAEALQEAQNYLRNITVRELQQFELGQDILKYEFNNGKELDPKILARQAEDKPLAHPYYWGAWICQGDTTPVKLEEMN